LGRNFGEKEGHQRRRDRKYGVARCQRCPRYCGEDAGFRPDFGELSGRPRTPLQNPRQVKEEGLDQAGRHRSGLSMGLPVRQARRHHMAIQKKSSRMAKKERILKNLVFMMYQVFLIQLLVELDDRLMHVLLFPSASAHKFPA